MEALKLEAESRPTGKGAARSLRRADKVPGVFYADGKPGVPVAIPVLALRPLVYTSDIHVIDLHIDGEKSGHNCIIKEIAFDPITDNVVHFDLQGLTAGRKIVVDIPLLFTGQSEGERAGGIVNHVLNKLSVECLPKDIPEHIEVEISELKIGSILRVSDIQAENLSIRDDANAVVCSVTAPKRGAVEEEEAELAAEETEEGAEEQSE